MQRIEIKNRKKNIFFFASKLMRDRKTFTNCLKLRKGWAIHDSQRETIYKVTD